jgi:hypothetical protein
MVSDNQIAMFGRGVPRAWALPLIVMTSLMVAHWFQDLYMNGNFGRWHDVGSSTFE